jgi:hypothetical protein
VTAWKDLERRTCRALGGERRGPGGGSDCVYTPFAVEVKRSKRGCVLSSWLAQAKRQGAREQRPWLLVVAGHNDRHPIAVMDFALFTEIAGHILGSAEFGSSESLAEL